MEHLFNASSEPEMHQCEGYRDGDWIVFLCPHCPDYERRLNWRTGAMKVRDNSDGSIRHAGEYFPDEIGYAFEHAN